MQERIVILRHDPVGGTVDFAVTSAHNVHVLAADRTATPPLVVDILRSNLYIYGKLLGGIWIKSIYVHSYDHTNAYQPPVEGSEQRPASNKVLGMILSAIGCAIGICYIIAIYKVCV